MSVIDGEGRGDDGTLPAHAPAVISEPPEVIAPNLAPNLAPIPGSPVLPVRARWFIAVFSIAGVVALVWSGLHATVPEQLLFVSLLAGATILGELRPIRAPLGSQGMEVTVSTAFGLAILFQFGAFWASIALVVGVVLADAAGRKPAWKIAFNAAQYVVSVVAAGIVTTAIAGEHVGLDTFFDHPRDIIGAALGGVTFFVVNALILGSALALALRVSLRQVLIEDFAYQVVSNVSLLALAPVAVVVGQRSPLLLPVLMIPLASAYRAALLSQEKEHLALHDPLTGLPNRVYFRSRIDGELARTAASGGAFGVLLLDLDRFKEVNDTLGHGMGDKVLQVLGPRLVETVGDDDLVARLGGDEFGVVLPDLAGPEDAMRVAERLLEAVRAAIELPEIALEVGGSIGVVTYPAHGHDADTLIQHADLAMYSAKEAHGGCMLYDAALDHTSPLRLALVSELRDAIGTQGLVVHYQPKVECETGAVLGAEALVRWQHPIRGLVPPDDFIPIAEQTGLIRELTHVVLDAAMADLARWSTLGLDLTVAVNISARTLVDLELPERIASLGSKYGVEPDRLILEITESTIMADPARSSALLSAVRGVGVKVSLDDYGTGHSALAQLKALPIDELKIDKSFITAMTPESADARIARSTVQLGHSLGLKVVAEGVETGPVLEMLGEFGCDVAQGYHFAKPLPRPEFEAWIVERNASVAATGRTVVPPVPALDLAPRLTRA